jgi:peptidoglycan/LPS O-acetylase OafA/YrhL
MVIPRHAWELLGGEFVGPVLKPIFKAGWIGVDLFFVLSGFLIGSQLFQSVRREGRVPFGRFYLKRTLRIMPSYYAVLALYFLWPAFREKPEIDPAWRFIFYVMNYGRRGEAFSHAWSLCIEEHFYLVFPFIVAACAWRPKVLRPAWLVGGALTGVIALRYFLWSKGAPFYPAVYRPSHTHFDGLTIGAGLAALREFKPALWSKVVSRPMALLFVGTVLIGCGVYEGFPQPIAYVLSFSLVSTGFGAIVAAALAPRFWLARTHIPGAATLAALAFTLYLTHKQMIHLAAQVVGEYRERPLITIALSVLFIVAAASSIHFTVERPFLKLRDRLLKQRQNVQTI